MTDPEIRTARAGSGSGRPIILLLWPSMADARATLRSVLAALSPSVRVLLPSGARSERLMDGLGAMVDAAPVTLLESEGAGFSTAMNLAAELNGAADLVVIADACRLPESWLSRLRLAAHSDDTVAAATALVARAGEPMLLGAESNPPGTDREESGEGGGTPASPSYPRVITLWPHCTLIRRTALELVGPFNTSLAHPAAVLADFAARAVARGLSCVLADDVWVERIGDGLGPCSQTEMDALSSSFPWRESAREEEAAMELKPLRRSIVAARAARRHPSVTIDARALGPGFGGTQTYVASLISALAKSGRLAVRAVVAADAPAEVVDAFRAVGVEVVTYEQAAAGVPRSDLVHRPQQVFTPHDLRLLRTLGERLVISQLDLISYRNPSYHVTSDEWLAYRRTTRLALAAADQVVFSSDHARRDAVTEDLIEPARTAIVGIGVDQTNQPETHRPAELPDSRDLILMLGANYAHKNRVFGLELVDELRRRHGWDGVLVMAGAHVRCGSSAEVEAEFLKAHSELAAHVVDLGAVSESEKGWLSEHAQAQLFPSTYEGFGLIPLEAAAAGCPCIYAASTSIREVIGPEAATIVQWDPRASADSAAKLLRPGQEREKHLETLSRALETCKWEQVVEELCQVYSNALASPYRSSAPHAWEELKREELLVKREDLLVEREELLVEREELIVELDAAYADLGERVAQGLPLIDRGGLLTSAQQQGLMRVASRRWLKGPLLGPLGAVGRFGRSSR